MVWRVAPPTVLGLAHIPKLAIVGGGAAAGVMIYREATEPGPAPVSESNPGTMTV